jgi:shikimate kinase
MKIITALIFISMISMICLSLTVSVKRVKKNKNNSSSKVKSEGEGDYKNGYTIPGFLISKSFNFDEKKIECQR